MDGTPTMPALYTLAASRPLHWLQALAKNYDAGDDAHRARHFDFDDYGLLKLPSSFLCDAFSRGRLTPSVFPLSIYLPHGHTLSNTYRPSIIAAVTAPRAISLPLVTLDDLMIHFHWLCAGKPADNSRHVFDYYFSRMERALGSIFYAARASLVYALASSSRHQRRLRTTMPMPPRLGHLAFILRLIAAAIFQI